MLLRSISKHVKDQNWFAVVLDFFIVVAGILIAFQITNWNEAKTDRKDEAAFLDGLHHDITNVEVVSSRLFDVRTGMFERLSELVDVLDGSSPPREFSERDCATAAYSDLLYVGRSSLPSVIQLRDAGRFGVIADKKLQQSLTQLTQAEDSMRFNLEGLVGKNFDIRKKYIDLIQFESNLIPDPSRPGRLERSPYVSSCEIDKIFSDPEFRNALVFNLEWYDSYMRDGLKPWRTQVQSVHSRVDNLLKIEHGTEETK